MTTPDQDGWRAHAVCRTPAQPGDRDVFFPGDQPGVSPTAQIRRARAVCATCPVQAECLDYSLDADITHGIWGGLTWKERRPLRTARQQELAGQRADRMSTEQVRFVLALLDAGQQWADVEKKTQIDRVVCWAVWQRHRPDSGRRGPDMHRGSIGRSDLAG